MAEITVVLCAYNGESFLDAQLSSIQEQTRLPDRLILLDDHSSDSTLEIAQRFAAGAPFRVDVVRNEVNVGFIANFEHGLERAPDTGLIVFSDQDDVWRPERLSRVEAAFAASPDAALVFSDADLLDEDLRPLGRTLWSSIGFSEADRIAVGAGRLFEILIRRTVVTGATMAIRGGYRRLLLPIGGSVGHDAWTALLLSAVAGAVPIAEPLIGYRQHGGNQVGAGRPGIRQRMRRSREQRLWGLSRWHSLHAEALTRLEGAREHAVDPRRLALLRASVGHLRTRSSLPASRARRVAPVARELLSGRYTRLSTGLVGAVADLLG